MIACSWTSLRLWWNTLQCVLKLVTYLSYLGTGAKTDGSRCEHQATVRCWYNARWLHKRLRLVLINSPKPRLRIVIVNKWNNLLCCRSLKVNVDTKHRSGIHYICCYTNKIINQSSTFIFFRLSFLYCKNKKDVFKTSFSKNVHIKSVIRVYKSILNT